MHFLSPLITLLLLAVLAFQCARLVWQWLTPTTTVQVAQVTASAPKAWLTSVVFKAQEARQAVNSPLQNPASEVADAVATWRLKGIYAEDNDSVAIIQTADADKGHVVEVGEHITKDYTISAITPSQVFIADNSGQVVRVLQLASNHLETLAANTVGGENLPPRTVQRPSAEENFQSNQYSVSGVKPISAPSNALIQHVDFKPLVVDGQTGWQLSAKSTQGFNQLRRLGLRQGDILLMIDGKPPSPEMWRVVMAKWRQSQEIRAKIKRHGRIETITIKQ